MPDSPIGELPARSLFDGSGPGSTKLDLLSLPGAEPLGAGAGGGMEPRCSSASSVNNRRRLASEQFDPSQFRTLRRMTTIANDPAVEHLNPQAAMQFAIERVRKQLEDTRLVLYSHRSSIYSTLRKL